ncbi:DUF2249 domain-containing protein [Corynebacterium comes]|uniref:DUF2249 domain-containing protein n=1 Tax=Corynebacterium comes TaxID=2675218 RepID=UPI0038B39AE8
MQLPISHAHEVGGIPTLNAAIIPHAVRHGAIHGALGSRNIGESMILIAPHNPLPLLEEVEARAGDFEVSYLREGPRDWHLKFTRTA